MRSVRFRKLTVLRMFAAALYHGRIPYRAWFLQRNHAKFPPAAARSYVSARTRFSLVSLVSDDGSVEPF